MKTTTVSQKSTRGFYAKACPRCKGDMYSGRDFYGGFVSCYQCGYETSGQKVVLSPISPRELSTIPDELLQESA